MDFYFSKGTIAFATLIALEELDLPYRLIKIDFGKEEQRGAEYMKKNPKGRVPLLVSDDGPISETPAILTYLAMKNQAANLLPQSPYVMGRVHEMMSYFASTFHVAHAMKLRGSRWSDNPAVHEELKLKVTQNMSDCAQYVETHLLKGPYLLGEYSIADMHLYALTNWLEVDGVDIAKTPRLANWRELMNAREAVKSAWQKAMQE